MNWIFLLSYCSSTGALDDAFDDLQAALQASEAALPSGTQDRSESPLSSGNEVAKTESSIDEQCTMIHFPASSSFSLPVADLKPKKSKQGRRPNSNANHVSATHEPSQPTVASDDSRVKDSVAEDALATSNAKSQVVVADDNVEDTDCSSSVMHREYFSHVRRVNLENLSLVIGSNLPVFQVPLCIPSAIMLP